MAVASAIMPKGVVLDVGAHDGADAISFAKFGHHVLSFEPNIQKRSMVLNNLRKANLTSKTLLHINFLSAAVGDQEGEQTFYADVAGKNKGGSEMDSLSPLYSNGSHTNRTTVKVTTIDAAVGARNVIFAKIDAQGWDGKVVLGARQTIRDGRLPILTMEVTPRLAPNGFASYMHSFELLARHGYRCFDCDIQSGTNAVHDVGAVPEGGPLQGRVAARDLYNHSIIARANLNQGGWTNVVCTSEVRLWGSSAFKPADDVLVETLVSCVLTVLS